MIKKKTLALIEKNSNKYSIYSIGIGNDFDRDLIKNAGIIGKGNYNFCTNIEGLNEVIANEVNNASIPYTSDFDIKSSLDKDTLYKTNSSITILRKNKVINYSYIIKNKNDNNDNNKINYEIKYSEIDKNKNELKTFCEKHEMIPIEIPMGEEISKLIIYQYLIDNSNLKESEKLKLALKYQIFTKDTSLFAEVELSQKITEEMKTKIIGNKENNIITKVRKINYDFDDYILEEKADTLYRCSANYSSAPKKTGFFSSIGNSIKNFFKFNSKRNIELRACCENACIDDCYDCDATPDLDLGDGYCCDIEDKEMEIDFKYDKEEEKKEKKEEKKDKKNENTKINLNSKEDIMKMINTQDFVSGFWDINEQTKLVKEKYNNEFGLLKDLKNKNIDDKIAMTVLMIYFINKEHPDILKELVMIMKKAKLYIQEKTKDTYENILKEIGIN